MTKDDLKQIVKKLMIAYKGEDFIDRERFDLWYELLKGFETGQVDQAVMDYISSERRPPRICDIRSRATSIVESEKARETMIWNRYKGMKSFWYSNEDAWEVYRDIMDGCNDDEIKRRAADIDKVIRDVAWRYLGADKYPRPLKDILVDISKFGKESGAWA